MNFDSVRRDVLSACLKLADKGYLAGTSGNVACRADDNHFAITPSASDYYAMKPDNVCIVRLSDLVCISGDRPSIELGLHALIFRKHSDCRASIHTHQPIASSYSLLGKDLVIGRPDHQRLLGETAPCLGYAPSGTNWLTAKLQKRLTPTIHAYLLRNHGVLCCAPAMSEAISRAETLEAACSDFFRSAIDAHAGDGLAPDLSHVLMLLDDSKETETAQ
jgi:L-fuculose-phosphate aldolase